ncbi:MAG: hypothetical protein Fur0010_07590 [Bdellovibrio sp.]
MKPTSTEQSQKTESSTIVVNQGLRTYGVKSSKMLSLRPSRSVKRIASVNRPRAAKTATKA